MPRTLNYEGVTAFSADASKEGSCMICPQASHQGKVIVFHLGIFRARVCYAHARALAAEFKLITR